MCHGSGPRKGKHTHTKKNLLELINEFIKMTGYKINIQKSVAFLYINNVISERESKKKIPLEITSKIK